MTRCLLLFVIAAWLAAPLAAADGNRLTYLDAFCDPYYPGRDFPTLTTPQWVGDPGVECVVVLAIDDMRDTEKYEAYLRPILDRLKQIDGRAPVSIMTCQVDPQHDRLKHWLNEGLSLEVHTFDHPCPCLAGGDFAKSKATYDKCVDLLNSIPGNKPVAFRMPCCDSLNTPSPRFWMEAFNKTTDQGNHLSIDTSVFNIITGDDPALPIHIRRNEQGDERFRRYVPFKSFVNTIEDYPYPYVIGNLCWQFPCVVPSDWSAQHVQKPNNPDTVRDLKLALDACVIKQGVYNLVFHPHGWIRSDQTVELIDHAVSKHGPKVKFLNFRECNERLTKHLLAGQPLRNKQGADNGVRLLDINHDSYMDVVIGNREQQSMRLWDATHKKWIDTAFSEKFDVRGPRFGVLDQGGQAWMLGTNGDLHRFVDARWQKHALPKQSESLQPDGALLDIGARLRDFDGDGVCELLTDGVVYRWSGESGWAKATTLPAEVKVASLQIRDDNQHVDDLGVRFVDLDGDKDDDIVYANQEVRGVWLFDSLKTGWKPVKLPEGFEIPLIARQGRNNGAWFHSDHLWVQNEDTSRLPDHVDRRTYAQLLGKQEHQGDAPERSDPPPQPTITPTDRKSAKGQEATDERVKDFGSPKSPEEALKSLVVKKGFKVELVAAEPLVVDPVAFDWGPDGRLWVIEMRDYPRGVDDQGKPGGRVKVLTDTNGDGRYDEAQLFLDDLPFPTGIKVWQKGVLVTAAPEVIYAEDTNNDGRADVKRPLYRGFGEGNQQHRVNGLRWNMDGWLYLGNGDSGGRIQSLTTKSEVDIGGRDLRIRPDTGELDAVSGATQYSLCFDDYGNRFGGNNSNPLWHYVIEDYQLRRNPDVKPAQTKQHVPSVPGNAPVFPLSRTITRFNDYHTANRFTSACGIEIYRDDYLGRDYTGNSFVCEPVHNLVHREVLSRSGISFTSRRAAVEQESEFLASTDNWFRPVMARTGPDGALYIADMYRMVIEHPTWIPEDWQKRLNVRAGDDKGRIYRVVRDDMAPAKLAALDPTNTAALVSALGSTNGTRRDQAQQLLVGNKQTTAADAVRELARSSKLPQVRVQALWTLSTLNVLEEDDLVTAMSVDAPVEVASAAVRLSDIHCPDSPQLLTRIEALVASKHGDDAPVALQTAFALARWTGERPGRLLGHIAQKHEGDKTILTATIASLSDKRKVMAFLDQVADNDNLLRQVENQLQVSEESWNHLADDKKWKSDMARMRRAVQLLATSTAALGVVDLKPQHLSVLSRLNDQAEQLVLDTRRETSDRTTACQLLMLQERWQQDQAKLANGFRISIELLQKELPGELRHSILDGVRRSESFPFDQLLYKRWLDRTHTERLEIFDVLIANEHAQGTLLKMLDPALLPASDLDATRVQLLLNHPQPKVREKAKVLTATIQLTDRAELLARYADVLDLRSDVARGRAAFRKRCTACHRHEGEGNPIGPDLASLTDKSSMALLTAMLDPNRAVEAKFIENLVITEGGQLISGVVTSETGTSLTLVAADGKEHTLLRKEIESIHSNKKSLMPEGLERDLTRQDFADIIGYLQATPRPPKQFDGNAPRLAIADEQGNVLLSADIARLYGPSLAFESKHKNLGWWQNEADVAEWSLQIPTAGRYSIELNFACDTGSAGNTVQLSIAGQTVLFKVPATGSWDDYKAQAVGTATLPAGRVEASVRSSGAIRGALIDLRGVKLIPTK